MDFLDDSMPVNLEELFEYKDSHAPWIAINEHLPLNLLHRNLKLLRGLSRSKASFINLLTEQEILQAYAAYQVRVGQHQKLETVPKTPAQFFHSKQEQSAYFSEIIVNPNRKSKGSVSSVSQEKDFQVHGLHLREHEAFSATRYYSDDKKSYAQIVAQGGEFTATHGNLNHEQKNDLAFEIAYQFLLNLAPGYNTVSLEGEAEMVHRVRAAFSHLQKIASPRYDNLIFYMPPGAAINPDESIDSYIKHHLGELPETPKQETHWREFLAMKPEPRVTGQNASLPSSTESPSPNKPREYKTFSLDMDKIFHSDELTSEDKELLNEYQRYLNENWRSIAQRKNLTEEQKIETYQKYMQRTEEVLRIFQKTPSFTEDFETLKDLYIRRMEAHHKLLDKTLERELKRDAQLQESLPQMQSEQRQGLERSAQAVTEHIEHQSQTNTNLNESQHARIQSYLNNMQEIIEVAQDSAELSASRIRSCGEQMSHALTFLESVHDYSKVSEFQELKKQIKEFAELKDPELKSDPSRLAQASAHVKERLMRFKQEFSAPIIPHEILDAASTKELLGHCKKVRNLLNKIDLPDPDLKDSLSTSIMEVNKERTRTTMSALEQSIELILPHLNEEPALEDVLNQIKKITSSASLVEHQRPQEPIGLSMPGMQ